MRTSNKSQGALEFLITYGWVFIGILVMMVTLSYFGILTPRKSLPNRCYTGSEFECRDFATFKNGVRLRLKNNIGVPIVINTITASNEKLACSSPTINVQVKSDEVKDIYLTCDISGYGFPEGEKVKLNTEISYYAATSSSIFSKKVQGEMFSAVQGSLYDQINSSNEAYPAISTASQMIDAVNAYKRDVGFYPLDVSRGNDPGLANQFPVNPETGELLSPAGSRCNPGNWHDVVQRTWKGPYMTAWPEQTPWGGEYDFNLWPDGASRYGQSVPPGIYLGIQRSRSDAPETAIPADVEADLVARGIDADGGVNGESQLFLSSITCEVPESNPNVVGTWHFDEGAGTTTYDSSVYHNDGTMHNNPVWIDGKKGKALSFDGNDDYVEILNSASLSMTNQITIIAWVKYDNVTGKTDQDIIINKESIPFEIAIGDKGNLCFVNLNQCPYQYQYHLNWYLGNIAPLSDAPDAEWGWRHGAGPIARGSWQHLALTYDGTQVRIFVNGQMANEYSIIPSNTLMQTNSDPLWIGARSGYDSTNIPDGGTEPAGNSNFRGAIDEVKIYNIALTPEQITTDYSS